MQFGRHIVKIPAQRSGEALLALLDLYRDKREPGEEARSFFRRVTKEEVSAALAPHLIGMTFENMREQDTVDLGQEKQFDVAIGRGECAA